nr:hypothetical protein [Lachnospiraceae bacterium]
MKKILAIILALVMVLTIAAACGKKEEPTEAPTEAPTTEAPTTPAPTTPAPTTPAPTTPAPTTEAPTTPAPTTEAPTTAAPTTAAPGPVLDDAQAVVDAALDKLEELLRAVGDESQARQLSFAGTGNAGLTMTISMGEQSMDIPITAKANAEGILDTAKGFHALAVYEADLGMLAQMLGSEEEDGPIQGGAEYYADFALQKTFENTDGTWYYSEEEAIVTPMDEDVHLAGQLVLADVFESYDFSVKNGQYVIEGNLKTEIPEDAEGMLPESITSITEILPEGGMTVSAAITINKDMEFTGFKLAVPETTINLSEEMEGFTAKVDGIEIEIALEWDEGTYELPKEVEEGAVEKQENPGYEDENYPWTASKFTLKNEELAETEEFTLKVKEVKANEFGEIIVDFAARNNLDKSLTFRFDNVAVNGFITGTYCSEEVTANTDDGGFEMTIYPGELSMIGVESVDQISFMLKVYDTDDYFSDGYINEPFTIYPTGADPEAYEAPERRTAEGEVVILDEDVKAVVMECKKETYFGYYVVCYFENNTDKDLSFKFEDVKLNGKELGDAYWYVDIPAGGRGFERQYFYDTKLQELEIEKLETIEAVLNVMEDDFFADEILFTADVLYEVK